MSIPFVFRRLLPPAWAAILLAGCGSSATPAMIASFPKQDSPPIATFPMSDPPVALHYYFTLAVGDVDWAAAQSEEIARDWGGYVRRLQSWYDWDGKHALAELVIPAATADSAYAQILRLGRWISGEEIGVEPCEYPNWNGGGCMSTIAVEFQPEAVPVRYNPPQFPDLLAGVFFAGLVLLCIALIVGILILFFVVVKKAAGWINKL